MTRCTYPAIIKTNGHSYIFEFIDFRSAFGGAGSLVDAIAAMNKVLEYAITYCRAEGRELPEPTPFEPIVSHAEGEVSWWVLAHCDVDDNEDFKRIMDGLNDIAKGDVVIKFDPQDNGIPADEAQSDLTVESMNEVLSRYRLDIGWDGMTVEEKSAFHANRPATSGLMRIIKGRAQ